MSPKPKGAVSERDGVVIGQYEVRTPEGGIERKHVRGQNKQDGRFSTYR